MRKPKKSPPPAPGEPRPCETKGCGALFVPGKGGWGGYCARCQQTIARGGVPGPRQRQPPGNPRLRIRAAVLPDMVETLTPDVLAAYGVESVGDFLVLAGARLLGRADFEPPKKRGP